MHQNSKATVGYTDSAVSLFVWVVINLDVGGRQKTLISTSCFCKAALCETWISCVSNNM